MGINLKKYFPLYYGYPFSNPEYFELRWDIADCILGCEFCWNPASRPHKLKEATVELNPTQLFRNTVKNIREPSRSFIRFAGGEPTLYWKELLQVFELFAKDEIMTKIPIVIKTNGIAIGMGTTNLHELDRQPFKELRFLFELSIKGTNPEEFELLTRTSKKLYTHQLTAYKMLKNMHNHNPNISFVTILGIYHSSTRGRSKFVFVYPNDQTLMFDGHRPWDKEFKKMWSETERKWADPLRTSKGQWENIFERCGPEGAKLLKHIPEGAQTNPKQIFPAKPNEYEHASKIVNNHYWHTNP